MQDHTRTHARATHRIAALGVAALAAVGLTLAAATPALAHDELTARTFTSDADGATTGVVLSFSNEIMPVGTEIVVDDASGTSVLDGTPVISGRDVTQPLVTPLETGALYKVTWRVVSSDGHPIQGAYLFEVAADGSAEVSDIDESDPRFGAGTDETEGSTPTEVEADTSDSASAEQSSFPVGGWIAIGAVVVLGVAAAVLFASKKRSTADDPAKTNDVEETH